MGARLSLCLNCEDERVWVGWRSPLGRDVGHVRMARKVARPLCARIRVGRGLERRQAGHAEVRGGSMAGWAGSVRI
jgi:hypothetical protein